MQTFFPVTKDNYKTAVKLVRHYASGFTTNDGYDLRKSFSSLTPYKKKKLRQYYYNIMMLRSRPHRVVRPRNKTRLRNLQQYAQHPTILKGLKAAFVPVADPDRPIKITYKKDRVTRIKETDRISSDQIKFDMIDLALDPEIEAQRAIDELKADRYLLMAGEYLINTNVSSDAESLLEQIQHFQNKYSKEDFDEDDPNSSYWGNWLIGVKGYYFDKTGDWRDYHLQKIVMQELMKELRNSKSLKKRKTQISKLKQARKLLKQLERTKDRQKRQEIIEAISRLRPQQRPKSRKKKL